MVLPEMTGASAFSSHGKGARVNGLVMNASGRWELILRGQRADRACDPQKINTGPFFPMRSLKTNFARNREVCEHDCHSTFVLPSRKRKICGLGGRHIGRPI